MKTINLFLADINVAGNTSGVDRHISELTGSLRNYPFINVYRINFRHDTSLLFCKETIKDGYTEFTIPMPQSPNDIISEEYWTDRYNANVYHITKHLFEKKNNIIFHLHTLNLIDFALLVKKNNPCCKIITHLHCIPWKGFFNSNINHFNKIYEHIYINNQVPPIEYLISNHCEQRAYKEADYIVCVTSCAKQFLAHMIGIPDSKIQIINNGISDTPETIVFTKAPTKEFRLLYVGSIIPSKGLFYILEAIRKLKEQGYSISLAVAGKGPQGYVKQLKQVNADIPIQFMGNIPFNKLKNYYQKCNAGIIASLQEQCSYAAIEMSMFGLPLIVTAVDGLDEMFTDEENALKIAVKFSKVYGLSIDTDNMASQLKRLIDDENLRNRLGINARKLYKEKFSLNDMVRKTVAIYNKLIN